MPARGCTCLGGCDCPWGCACPGGAYPGGCTYRGVCSWGGVSSRGGGVGVCSRGMGVCLIHAPPVNRMTNRCKNITLATTSLRPVIRGIILPSVPFRFMVERLMLPLCRINPVVVLTESCLTRLLCRWQ